MSEHGPVVVVGAGMAGLGAAGTLRRAGKDVIVLERLDVVGGLARTIDFEGHVFDVGPHYFFLDVSDDVNALVKTSLKPEEWRPIDFKIAAKIGRRHVPWPPTSSAAFKLPLSGIYQYLKNAVQRRVPHSYVTREFLIEGFGRKMYDIFLGPYILKKVPVNEGPENLHRDWWNQTARTIHNVPDVKRDKLLQVEPKLVQRYLERYPSVRARTQASAQTDERKAHTHNVGFVERLFAVVRGLVKTATARNYKKVLYPPQGVGVITERVAEDFVRRGGRLELRASNVTLAHDGRRITRVTWDGGVVEHPEHVVWTGSIHRLCTLLDVPREELPFMTILLGLMKLKRPLPEGEDLYTYIADPDIVFNRIYYPNRSVGGLCPPGKDSLCVEITTLDPEVQRDPERLTDAIVSGLERLKVCRREDIEKFKFMWVPDSYPVYPLDYREKLDRIWQRLDEFENVRSIGRSGQFWYNNMARSMRAGIETAQDLLGAYEP